MIKWIGRICYITTVLVLIILTTINITKQSIKPQIQYVTVVREPPNIGKICDDSVMNHLKRLKIRYPKVALAQIKLESENYKSPLFKRQNNLLGMTPAEHRPTTSQKSKNKYAFYTDYIASIEDYAMWQSSFISKIKSQKEYISYIGKHYASDPNYQQKIKHIVDTL